MRKHLIVLMSLVITSLSLGSIEAVDILRKIDGNEVYTSIKYEADMIIKSGKKEYVKNMTGYSLGNRNFFAEFTNADDAGTKYLKKDGNLYVYSPDAEEVIPITGHMLKESMMGSDMSYEDTINNDTLESLYNATISEEIQYEGKSVWVLDLVGKKKTISYPKQRMWIDKENFTVWKAEKFALSGTKLKEEKVLEYKKIGNRYFPVNVEVRDMLRKDSLTTFKYTKIELDVKIPENMFSLKNLEK